MSMSVTTTTVREATFPEDGAVVARLVGDYLRQTEREKAERGLAAGYDPTRLPERYQAEVDDPATAFSGATVLLGLVDGEPAGVVVVSVDGESGVGTVKRLWVDPSARGAGLGRLLLEAVVSRVAGPTRLSVWHWRDDALRAYTRLGFVEVPTWEAREQLVCLERPEVRDT